MKKILLVLALSLTALVSAQIPQGISYQAIAYNGTAAVANGNVGLRLSVLNGSPTGTAVYVETHVKTTNAQGLFNLVIGQGTAVSGTFAGINWATGSKFLKVEMDAAGGTNYAPVGTTQLLSSPYAMVAGSLAASATGNTVADQINESKFANFAFNDYGANKVYVYNARNGSWSSQAYTADSISDIQENAGSFYFKDYAAAKVYFFSAKTGTWSNQSFTIDESSEEFTVSGSNIAFKDFGTAKVYVVNARTNTWSSQSFTPDSESELTGTNGNFSFIDYDLHQIYIYSNAAGTWTSQVFTADSSPQLNDANGVLTFIDYDAHKVYAFSPSTGAWSSQSFTADSSPTIISSPNN
jgi:hypothetical protein